MAALPGKPRVGLLALTLEFYERGGPGIRQGREQWVRDRVLPALAEVAEVRFDGAAWTREQVDARVAEFEAAGCECLLVMLLTYATSLTSLPALMRTRLPVVVWNTQELYAVDESYDSPRLTANHGVHGTFDLGNVLTRAGVPFAYVTSHLDDAGAVAGLGDALRAGATATRLRNFRVGLMGYPFPGMGDFGLDTTHLAATLGVAWESLSVVQFNRLAADAASAEVAALTAEYRDSYDVAPAVSADDLAATARAELALRRMVREHRLDAVSYQFLAFGEDDRTATLPFVAASRLMAEGVGFGGEGDLISASFAAAMNRLAPPASFSEIFSIDFGGNSLLLSHMGEANPAMGTDRVRLVKRARPIVPVRVSQLALAATWRPGPATLAALTPGPGGRWRIIASAMRMQAFGPLPQLEVPHAKIAPDGDVRDWLTAYATAGGPHHLAVCYGDARAKLKHLARWVDAEYIEV